MRRVISFVLLLLASIARAETPVDKLALDAMKQWKLPGLAIAIVKDDKVVLTKGYGVKEIGGTAPITDETLFQIASTSKAFTTTAMPCSWMKRSSRGTIRFVNMLSTSI